MENLSMCRICLATDVRLCSIASHLRDMYERITAVTFEREDRRPLAVCYICHARLQNCNQLRTSCLRSEELLTEMMSSGMLKPQKMLSTNMFGVVSVLHLSVGHALQDSTECHIMEAVSEVISDTNLDQLYTEDILTEAQGEQRGLIDDSYQSSHLEDPIDIIKEEADDVETDAEYINLEDGNIKIEENGWEPNIIGWEPDTARPSSQSTDSICPKIVKVVLERIDLNSSWVGARISKKLKIAALKDTEDATTNKRKIEVIKNEQTEFEEPKIVTKKIEVGKQLTASKILDTCDKADIKLNKCDDNVLTSVVNDVGEQKSTNYTFLEQDVSGISSRKNKPFSCDTCNKCFSYKHVLKNHILTHTGVKPYQCNFCKKRFIQKGHLQRHVFKHTSDKPYQRNVSNKSFSYEYHLKDHIRTHTSDKPYQCNICKKCFVQKSHLLRHVFIHTSDKPYQCNICKKCFRRKDNLKTHIRIHTGDKPYQCNICKKCFTLKDNLKIHIRAHTGDKPYQCNICKRCFSQSSSYSRHIRIHKR